MSDYTVKDMIEILREYTPESIFCVSAIDDLGVVRNFSILAIEEQRNGTYVSTDDTMHEDDLVVLIID